MEFLVPLEPDAGEGFDSDAGEISDPVLLLDKCETLSNY